MRDRRAGRGYVREIRPEAAHRTFVLGEFGRLLRRVDLSILPPAGDAPDSAYDRGVALVVAVDAARGGGAVWGSDGQRREPSRRPTTWPTRGAWRTASSPAWPTRSSRRSARSRPR